MTGTFNYSANNRVLNKTLSSIHLASDSESMDNVNFVNRNLATGNISYEVFDEYRFSNRNASSLNMTNPFSSHNVTLDSNVTVHGNDDRRQVENGKTFPYIPTAKMVSFYYNVYNRQKHTRETRVFVGTAFLEAQNLAVTAGHCCYSDVTNEDAFQDNVYNPRFPDKIELFFGCTSENDMDEKSSYQFYAEGTSVRLEYAYYNSPNFNHDWACISLDRDIGFTTRWYGKTSTQLKKTTKIFSWGYPADKPEATLWEVSGQITDKTDYQYHYDLDTAGGQSGSPIFTTINGSEYVCAIHTQGNKDYSSGTIMNPLMFAYLNSFVTSANIDEYDFLQLAMVKQSGSDWYINITNNTSHIRKVFYNKKMCFEDDAKNWTNLKDIEMLTLYPYSSKQVVISKNWFATDITVSYEFNGHRVITYAHDLDSQSLNSFRVVI